MNIHPMYQQYFSCHKNYFSCDRDQVSFQVWFIFYVYNIFVTNAQDLQSKFHVRPKDFVNQVPRDYPTLAQPQLVFSFFLFSFFLRRLLFFQNLFDRAPTFISVLVLLSGRSSYFVIVSPPNFHDKNKIKIWGQKHLICCCCCCLFMVVFLALKLQRLSYILQQ